MITCSNLAVPMQIMQHVIHVESSYNPYAIGVVGGHLARQPKNLSEAVATAKMLEQQGYNFSLGIAQVNRYNLAKYSIKSYAEAFNVCTNLQAGTHILRSCYERANGDWGKAFSCYYSGNFVTGYKQGYVQKVIASINQSKQFSNTADTNIIQVYGNRNRHAVAASSYPAYGGDGDGALLKVNNQQVRSEQNNAQAIQNNAQATLNNAAAIQKAPINTAPVAVKVAAQNELAVAEVTKATDVSKIENHQAKPASQHDDAFVF